MILILNGTPKHDDLAQAQSAAAFYRRLVDDFASTFGNDGCDTYWKCREQAEDAIATLNDVLQSATGLLTMPAPECWRCGKTSMPMLPQHYEFIHKTTYSMDHTSLTRHRCDGWACRTCGFFIGVDDGRVVF